MVLPVASSQAGASSCMVIMSALFTVAMVISSAFAACETDSPAITPSAVSFSLLVILSSQVYVCKITMNTTSALQN